MINEELKKGLQAVGIKVADDATNEDAIKLLKANKKVLKAHDGVNDAIAEGPEDELKDPDEKEVVLPMEQKEDPKPGDAIVEAVTPPADPKPADPKPAEQKPAVEEPPKVPAKTAVTPKETAEPSKQRKFGKAFPDRN